MSEVRVDTARAPRTQRAQILVGTSGYSFPDWPGRFYPEGMKSGDFLEFYARHFPAVEVNSTYYRIPPPRTLERMAAKTPPEFRFVVKLHGSMTHEHSLGADAVASFRAMLEPLKQTGKFDGLLAQFPYGFHRTPANRLHLAAVRDAFADEPLFVEFRHDSWLAPEVVPALRERRIGWCAVDEPALPHLLPPVTHLTSEDAYVRFHGRNAATWYGGGGERYDWDYQVSELTDWVKKIGELADQARRVYLFFNNCHAGQAARSAKLMQELLRQEGLTV
ncbi:MAG: DUF72 domain-containing protein [Candidatus Eisenbacteria bacterium]|uniref:DUF72 domain-containing protein n=1 Tax=Eiseniibacteriota bacterium TaxID=2212470 RepID=A0A849SEH8_UNCEI|nr:DUF72 domain-containing protein [Candidatus Eisenbacteria bacterium]